MTRDCTSWSCRSYEGSEHGGLIQSHGIITLLWPLSISASLCTYQMANYIMIKLLKYL